MSNTPSGKTEKEKPSSLVLGDAGIIDEYIFYKKSDSFIKNALILYRHITKFNPDLVVYLMPTRNKLQLLRDFIFFKFCNIRNITGLKFKTRYQRNIYNKKTELSEPESHRLARLVGEYVNIELNSIDSWSLNLQQSEIELAKLSLGPIESSPFFVISLGTKFSINHWGLMNWGELIAKLNLAYPDFSIVAIGSEDEYDDCDRVLQNSRSKKLNLCGKLSPRVSSAVMRYANFFIGHDSGPMHLASTQGIPIVAIFSGKNKPGEWFPHGKDNMIIYHKTACFGCGLSNCVEEKKKCITSITCDEVFEKISIVIKSKK